MHLTSPETREKASVRVSLMYVYDWIDIRSMEDTFKRHRQTLAKPQSLTTDDRRRPRDLSTEEGNSDVWNNFSNRFRQVQSVLDRNRSLIQQVNENHQSRTTDNMVRNVSLIQELNGNISKVVSLYSDISTNFSTMFRQGNDFIGDDTNNHWCFSLLQSSL